MRVLSLFDVLKIVTLQLVQEAADVEAEAESSLWRRWADDAKAIGSLAESPDHAGVLADLFCVPVIPTPTGSEPYDDQMTCPTRPPAFRSSCVTKFISRRPMFSPT